MWNSPLLLHKNKQSILQAYRYFRCTLTVFMLNKLQQKWKVGPVRLLLILITFAVGGSLTGWIGKKLMPFLDIKSIPLYIIVYLIVVTVIWPLMVILVSIPLGQFTFFRHYLAKLGRKLAGKGS
jgi:hypothetical protein